MSKTFAKAASFPLSWPQGFPVHKSRQSSRFNTTLFQALENVQTELKLLARDSGKKIDNLVISSNYSLTETKPANPGVAVWFEWDGDEACIPVDRYNLVEDNLQAIYHCIKADRTKIRHGGYQLVKAAYRRTALPSPDNNIVDWRAILGTGTTNTIEKVEQYYRQARKKAHPDHGGSTEAFMLVEQAWLQAKEELA